MPAGHRRRDDQLRALSRKPAISEPGRSLRLPRRARLREGPTVSGDVEEDSDAAVRFGTRRAYEGDADLGHPPVSNLEVIDTKEEPDPSGCLMTDGRTLVFSV